jgi:hypothetical protein
LWQLFFYDGRLTRPVLTSEYTTGTKIFLGAILLVGPMMFAAAAMTDGNGLTGIYRIMVGALRILWICAAFDIFGRRIWVYEDRIVARIVPFTRTSIRFADVHDLKFGLDYVTLKAGDGRSIRVLGRMQHYQEIVQILASLPANDPQRF